MICLLVGKLAKTPDTLESFDVTVAEEAISADVNIIAKLHSFTALQIETGKACHSSGMCHAPSGSGDRTRLADKIRRA